MNQLHKCCHKNHILLLGMDLNSSHQLECKMCQALTGRIVWGMVLFYFYAF